MVAKHAEDPSPGQGPEKADDFDKRHEQELGVKHFTVSQGKLLLIPTVTMGIGGLIGYHTLGKPLTKMFPRVFKGIDTTKEVVEAVRDAATGRQGPKWDLKAAKWAGAAVMGTIGSMVGSIFVGYDKWRKEETTRLAAEDIERDISRMELFRPSDPELVAENKRLRSMLAEAEQKHPHHEGAQADKPVHQVHSAQHHGKHEQQERTVG